MHEMYELYIAYVCMQAVCKCITFWISETISGSRSGAPAKHLEHN